MLSILALAIGATLIVVAFGTPVLRKLLVAKGIYDNPNARSSHHLPTPRGGGIVVLLAIIIGLAILGISGYPLPTGLLFIVLISFALSCLSWMDDVRNLSPFIRLACQALAVGSAILIDPSLIITSIPHLPASLSILITAAIWIWFVNLYNFMDGIDGMTGVQTLSISLGIGLLGWSGALSNENTATLAIIGAAAFAFLFWNWSPSKIFLGDVGSIPLGFILGWVLIRAINEGAWAAAIIIPGFYLADATITLLRRAIRGEKIWTAHRQHFYQMPVLQNVSHSRIMFRVIAANAALICTALWVLPINNTYGLALGGLIIAGLLWHLSQLGKS